MARLLSDVDYKLSVDERGEIIVHKRNRDIVRNSIALILGVMLGEVPFSPRIGTSIYLQSFNFLSDIPVLQETLRDEIEAQVQNATVVSVRAQNSDETRILALDVGVQYVGEPDIVDVSSAQELPHLT